MANNFDFVTGTKTFTINGDPERTISFSPSDNEFIQRVYEAVEKLEKTQKKYQVKVNGSSEAEKVFKVLAEADEEIRKIIDDIFQVPGTSKIVFGKESTLGFADGSPIWANFIIALISECDEYITVQNKTENPKLRKLLNKYKK